MNEVTISVELEDLKKLKSFLLDAVEPKVKYDIINYSVSKADSFETIRDLHFEAVVTSQLTIREAIKILNKYN